jgi:hypothetical protein
MLAAMGVLPVDLPTGHPCAKEEVYNAVGPVACIVPPHCGTAEPTRAPVPLGPHARCTL